MVVTGFFVLCYSSQLFSLFGLCTWPTVLMTKCNLNANVYDYSPDISANAADYTVTTLVLEPLLSSHPAAIANHYSAAFCSSGIHHCWVARGSMEWEVCPTLVHMTSSETPDLNLTPISYPLSHWIMTIFLMLTAFSLLKLPHWHLSYNTEEYSVGFGFYCSKIQTGRQTNGHQWKHSYSRWEYVQC